MMARPSYMFAEGFWERLEDEIYKQNRTKKDIAKQCGFDRKILYRNSSHDNIWLPYFARLCEAVNFSVSMGKNPSSKIQICTIGCRIMGLILVSIYLSDYSITNFHGSIQECQTFLHQK